MPGGDGCARASFAPEAVGSGFCPEAVGVRCALHPLAMRVAKATPAYKLRNQVVLPRGIPVPSWCDASTSGGRIVGSFTENCPTLFNECSYAFAEVRRAEAVGLIDRFPIERRG